MCAVGAGAEMVSAQEGAGVRVGQNGGRRRVVCIIDQDIVTCRTQRRYSRTY